jgi:alkanesulfonate monooxygenase SsuD/methylene tetrahydromethanopterin reductase-like flavin-dependent oxidoreductase (luciferase family)
LRKAAVQAGRSADRITPALFVSVRIDTDRETGRRAMDDYATATYGMPLAELEKIQAVITGTADEVAEGLDRYVAAGARHLVIRLGALDFRTQRDQLERVAALLPSFRAGFPDQADPDRCPGLSCMDLGRAALTNRHARRSPA